MYSYLHVMTTGTGSPTLDVVIQSDDNAGMTSPTTRITHAQKTAIGAELLSVAGAVMDDYWRVNFTIGGSSPSFLFAVMLGIN